jgi:hypothetical protein
VKHVYEVLREKEIAIERVRREIEALRSVCHLLCDEGDSTSDAFESGVERKEKSDVLRPANERGDAVARIRARLVDTRPKSVKKGSGSSVLLQFRQVALGASRTFLRRVLDSPLLEHEPQRKAFRDLFERLARSNAA